MKNENISRLTLLNAEESALIFGGVDKKAQDALYTIGYVIGLIVRFIGALFSFNHNKQAETVS
ncbi:MAG: hypothetical protein KBS38_05350 [Bacteroidales bacterium]|nr:hypothetical protein [Candidatus Cacconaster caballi]